MESFGFACVQLHAVVHVWYTYDFTAATIIKYQSMIAKDFYIRR